MRTIMKRLSVLLFTVATMLPLIAGAQEASEENKAKKFQFLFNVYYQSIVRDFSESTSFTKDLEQGTTTRSYSGGDGSSFEMGGAFSLTPKLAVVTSVEILSSVHEGTLEISSPHPLLFNRPRETSMPADALDYYEFTVHANVTYRIPVSKMEIELFAGPSMFFPEIELIDQATTDSQYPFDELTITSSRNVTLEERAIGFNVGGGVTYYLTESLGLSFVTRYSRASLEAMREGGQPISLELGGLRVGGGFRLRF